LSGYDLDAVKNFDEGDIAIINGLRNNTNFLVTTYTYDPLVGITTSTDPRGYQMFYNYDAQRRLIDVRDERNQLLTDYKYHYAGEQD